MVLLHSSIPRACDALFALANATLTPLGVQVVDSAVDISTEADVFVVAVEVPGDARWGAIGRKKREEEYDIECVLYARGGDSDMSARRYRVFEIFAALEAALHADYSLGGAVRTAAPTEFNLQTGFLQQQAKGTGSEFRIKIHITAPVYNSVGSTP